MPIEVRALEPGDDAAWDHFTSNHALASPMHTIAWKNSVQSVFGYRPFYRLAVDGSAVRGVLPLFLVRNPIVGKVLLSTPFAVYGGILAADAEAHAALAADAARLAREQAVDYLELRNAWPEQCAGFTRLDRYVTFTQESLPASGDELLGLIERGLRNRVRKALKFPYSSRMAQELDAFYELICRLYRRHGTPVFPRRWFETLLREFGPLADVREVVLEGEVVAASFNFHYRREMCNYYTASADRHRDKAPNHFLYYDHLLWAGAHDYRRFDFGRSKLNTGNVDFKKQWPTVRRELPYEVLLVRRRELPDFTQKNPRFDFVSRLWGKLPLPVTRWLGPRLVRLFP